MVNRLVEKLITLLFDILAISVAFAVTFWIRYKSTIFPESVNPELAFSSHMVSLCIFTAVWIVLFFFSGLYRDWYKESRFDECIVVSRTVLLGMFFLFLITGAPQMIEFAKSGDPTILFTRTKMATLLTYGACMLFFANADRLLIHSFLVFLYKKGFGADRVLIIGTGNSSSNFYGEIQKYPHLGFLICGFIDNSGSVDQNTHHELPVFGGYGILAQTIREKDITGIIISDFGASAEEILKIIEACGDTKLIIYMVPSLFDVVTGHLKTNQIFGVPLLVLLQDHMPPWEAQIKRIFDVCVSIAVLILSFPIWILTILIIRMTSKGPAIFRQERVGRNGKPFIMLKFRSMYIDAEAKSGPVWAKKNDPRITPVGRFMRKTRIDEIPQFVNVIKGEMSIVGPRPERAAFIEKLRKEIPWYIRRIKMTPGITGWAQVKHKYDETIEDVKQKVIYDLYYFENMSLMLDLKILLRTLWVVIVGKGAH